MKKGLSKIGIVLIILIFLMLSLISFNIFRYMNSEDSPESLIQNLSEKDFNYYLPDDFAAIKIKRGVIDANISGIVISFKDDEEKVYDYSSSLYPGPDEEKTYLIFRDDLSPKIPDTWNFSKVRLTSLRYIMESGKPSLVIYSTEINPNKVSKELKDNCVFDIEGGTKKVSCQ